MSKKVFATHPSVPPSATVRAGDVIFLSGQVPFGPDGARMRGDIAAQTRQVLDNISEALAEAGAGSGDVVKTTICLTDPADCSAFNTVYRDHFRGDPPARSCVASRGMIDARSEIEAVAYKPADSRTTAYACLAGPAC